MGNGRFEANPDRGPLGARFWTLVACKPAITSAFWNHWVYSRFGPNPGQEPFGGLDVAKPVPAQRGDPCPKTAVED